MGAYEEDDLVLSKRKYIYFQLIGGDNSGLNNLIFWNNQSWGKVDPPSTGLVRLADMRIIDLYILCVGSPLYVNWLSKFDLRRVVDILTPTRIGQVLIKSLGFQCFVRELRWKLIFRANFA